jgi:hypothetical protein
LEYDGRPIGRSIPYCTITIGNKGNVFRGNSRATVGTRDCVGGESRRAGGSPGARAKGAARGPREGGIATPTGRQGAATPSAPFAALMLRAGVPWWRAADDLEIWGLRRSWTCGDFDSPAHAVPVLAGPSRMHTAEYCAQTYFCIATSPLSSDCFQRRELRCLPLQTCVAARAIALGS